MVAENLVAIVACVRIHRRNKAGFDYPRAARLIRFDRQFH